MSHSKLGFISKAALFVAILTGFSARTAQAAMYAGQWVLNEDGSHTILNPRYATSGGHDLSISPSTPGENVCALFGLSAFTSRTLGPHDPKRMIVSIAPDGKLKAYFDGEIEGYESVTCACPGPSGSY